MEHVHQMDFVHRDLLAKNIIINSNRECKVAEFGLAYSAEILTHNMYVDRVRLCCYN